MLRQPPFAAGTLAVAADLHGTGVSPHAIAASLNGFAGATMEGGTIETRVLEQALGRAIARANPLGLLGGEKSEIRCLALRATASGGRSNSPLCCCRRR